MKELTETVNVLEEKHIPTNLMNSGLVQALVDDQGRLMVRFNRGSYGDDKAQLVLELQFNNVETTKIRSALLKGAVE